MTYWEERQQRYLDLKAAGMAEAEVTEEELREYFEKAIHHCERTIQAWYERYASENGISYADAQKVLDARELHAFKMDLKEYTRLARREGLSDEYVKMLDQASIRARLTKIQALYIELMQYVEEVSKRLNVDLSDLLNKVYESTYYKTAYETQKTMGAFSSFNAISRETIEKAVSRPWAPDGKDFSERIWNDRQALANTLRTQITQSLLMQEGSTPMIERVSKRFNVTFNNAKRLVETETAYVQESAFKSSLQNLGIKKYKLLAVLDSRTSDICRELDGHVYDLAKAEPGLTMPPFHCYCRTTMVPYIRGITDEAGTTRMARDDVTNKSYRVNGNMTYSEWRKSMVQQGSNK
ncbi:MAG: minor capsid protein [Acidaminococcaceae bacterium]|nr:minor capsid protein [Acidaminococcaceae bacterium]